MFLLVDMIGRARWSDESENAIKTMQEDSSHPKEKESFKPASNQIRQEKGWIAKKRKPDYLIGGWLERFPLLSLFCFSETLSKKHPFSLKTFRDDDKTINP